MLRIEVGKGYGVNRDDLLTTPCSARQFAELDTAKYQHSTKIILVVSVEIVPVS